MGRLFPPSPFSLRDFGGEVSGLLPSVKKKKGYLSFCRGLLLPVVRFNTVDHQAGLFCPGWPQRVRRLQEGRRLGWPGLALKQSSPLDALNAGRVPCSRRSSVVSAHRPASQAPPPARGQGRGLPAVPFACTASHCLGPARRSLPNLFPLSLGRAEPTEDTSNYCTGIIIAESPLFSLVCFSPES